jgi:shikimate kinase
VLEKKEENNVSNLFLIGFMGVGKSTVAQYLKDHYGLSLVEMDETIEAEEGMKITEIFAKKGEEYFRELETGLLRKLSCKKGVVVSCGGGTAMRPVNVELMKSQGRIIWLCATPESVYERIKDSTSRPVLAGNMNVEYIQTLMERRREAYEAAADFEVSTDGRSAAQICQEIMNRASMEETEL